MATGWERVSFLSNPIKGQSQRMFKLPHNCNGGDLGSIPGLGRSPGEGKGYPLQYSGLGHKESDSTDRLSLSTSLGLERKPTFSSPVATAEFSKFADILSAALL